MADDEKTEETRVARTAGSSGTFHVGELTVTPQGTELTRDQWLTVADAAVVNHVIVRLDEEFSRPAEEAQEPDVSTTGSATAQGVDAEPGTNDPKTQDSGTEVDGTPPPVPSTGSTRKVR